MDHIHFPYRSDTHLPLLHVINESGAWEKYGLHVNYDYKITSSNAHRQIPRSEVEFVGGNHVSTYGHRARGDTWVYLGQTVNYTNCRLVARPDDGIDKIADLKGRVVGSKGAHPGLNDWLFLKQHGLDSDRDAVDLRQLLEKGQLDEKEGSVRRNLVEMIASREIDAAFLTPPKFQQAQEMGLKVIEVERFPMIWFTTLSTSLTFVEKHPDIVERFLKGMLEGVAFFKLNREKSIRIIMDRYTLEGQLTYDQAATLRDELAEMLEPRLYPSLQAISNVYEEAKKQDPDANRVNPFSLWDMHHIRRIDDTGFIDQLYAADPAAAGR